MAFDNEYNIVKFPDDSLPIVVLYGPPACGKTMMLVRLSRYLMMNHYMISPELSFRPSYAPTHEKMRDVFDDLINSEYSVSSTANIMLLTVYKKAKTICRILDAPGELYFHPHDPEREYPPFIHELTNSNNRKVWAFIAEPDWSDSRIREKYVERIDYFVKSKISRERDRCLLVYNKIDRTVFIRDGYVDVAEAIKHMKTQYEGIMERFKNQHPITKFWKPYNCVFVPFTTGAYSKTNNGEEKYLAGPDIIVQKLWNAILKQL